MGSVTGYVILAVVLALSAYDVAVCVWHGQSATISLVLYGHCRENPIIPFALGTLLGHVLWPHG